MIRDEEVFTQTLLPPESVIAKAIAFLHAVELRKLNLQFRFFSDD
jgi:hypothetical protein